MSATNVVNTTKLADAVQDQQDATLRPVRTDGTKWSPIREVKESVLAQAGKTVRETVLPLTPVGAISALVFIVFLVLRADGIEPGLKAMTVAAISLVVAGLGVATLPKGEREHATIGEKVTD